MAEERRLEDMSLKELKQHAKRAGISGYGKMSKEQLIAVLTSSPATPVKPTEPLCVREECQNPAHQDFDGHCGDVCQNLTIEEETAKLTAEVKENTEAIETAPEAKTAETTEAVEAEPAEEPTETEVDDEVQPEKPAEKMVKAACPSCKQPVEFPKALFLAGQRPECSNLNCPSNRGVQKPVVRPTPVAKPTPVVSVETKVAEPRVEKLEEKNGVVEAGTGEHRTYERRGLSKAIAEYFESKGLNPNSRKVAGNSYVPRDWNVDLSADIRQEFGRKFSPTLEELLTSKLYFDVYPTMPKHFRADWIKAGLPIFCFDDPSELIDDPQLQQLWIKTGHVRCAEHSEAWNKEVQVQAADGTPRTMSRKWARFNELTGGVPELGDEAIAQHRIEKEAREAKNAAKDPLAGIINATGISANRYANETCQVCDEPSVRSQSGDKRDSKLCVSHRNEREKAMTDQRATYEAKKAAENVPTTESEPAEAAVTQLAPAVVEPQFTCGFNGCQNPVAIEGDVCEGCISLTESQQAESVVPASKKLIPGHRFFQPASHRPDVKKDEKEAVEQVASNGVEEEALKATEKQAESEMVAKPESKPNLVGISAESAQKMISGAIKQNNLSQKQMVRDLARTATEDTARKVAREEVSAGLSKLTIPDSTDVNLEAVAKATAEAAAKEAVGIEMRRIEGYLFNTIESEVAIRMSGKAADILEKIDSRGYATKEEVAQAIETGYQRIDNAIDRIERAVLSAAQPAPADPEETTEDNFENLPLFGAEGKIEACLSRLKEGN